MGLFVVERWNYEGGRKRGSENGLSRRQNRELRSGAWWNNSRSLLSGPAVHICLATEAGFPWGPVIHWISTKIVLCRLWKPLISRNFAAFWSFLCDVIELHTWRYILKISILILENFRIVRKLLLFVTYKINYFKFMSVNVFTEALLVCRHTRVRSPDVGYWEYELFMVISVTAHWSLCWLYTRCPSVCCRIVEPIVTPLLR